MAESATRATVQGALAVSGLEPQHQQQQQQRSEVSKPIKRMRWATKRATGQKAHSKRESILNRLQHRTSSAAKRRSKRSSATDTDPDMMKAEGNESESSDVGRSIFFNIPLPPNARDEDGHPINHFARNKIRTAKYTPLSFIPKNLWFQFHNIANVYFLFCVILSVSAVLAPLSYPSSLTSIQAFPIFGASDPGLVAVPIICILTITAIKDAIEDWRRTMLDAELNNAPVHRLIGLVNPNTAEDKVSMWRRFKKANTRAIIWIWRSLKYRKGGKRAKGYTERALDESRPSVETRRPSVMSRTATKRSSYHSVRSHGTEPSIEDDAIQMTPVPSPMPGQDPDETIKTTEVETAETSTEANKRDSVQPVQRFYGSIINPHKQPEDNARFKKDFWKNVQVGDILRLYDGEEVPADMVILSTSDPDGSCYIETKNLDGETNLKVRNALHCSRGVRHARHCEQAEFTIDSESPHANLYSYSGVIRWTQQYRNPEAPTSEMAEPISINNLLPRGSSLRNTEWTLGVVVFTGRETKIMLNSGITPSKRAKIAKDLNWNVLYNFIILFLMCLVAAVVEGSYWGLPNTSKDWFEFGSYGSTPALNGFITFWAAVILFQDLIPISLYITLEIIRTLQAVFIYSDVEMYDEKLDYPCTPKSWNISDDVGQIEYIFSDKTGTLTQNVMEFKKCSINGEAYGEAYTEALAGMQKRQGVDVEVEGAKARKQIEEDRKLMLQELRKLHHNPYLLDDKLTFVAPDFVADLAGVSGEEQAEANKYFMLALALCHTVISERTAGDPPTIEFKAQSPDEAALVSTARDCGFTVLGRTDHGIIINVLGEDRTYEILNILEFNSTRKRMSAIIRMPDGKIKLFCKGADSMIYSRLKRGEQPELRRTTAEHLEMFAREGLRTLCVAEKDVDEEEYKAWSKEHDLAAASIADREENLDRVADMIERDLTLLGGTAIEDRLQDGVPDAIQLLGKAGIKLWVLTGDKVETAINIGFSCNLLDNNMDLIVLKIEEDDTSIAEAELDKHLSIFGMTGSDEELKAAQTDHEPPPPTHALVIDGDSLKLVLDEQLRQKFLLLCKQCRAVLCCRVSPSQKAAVVQMVKNGLDCLTLSIGDGANDVAMIQEAHVGVGIAGEEGRQAVMSSDFAIAQFRFLTRLVLVHGRWSYKRLAETIANFFYKVRLSHSFNELKLTCLQNIVWTFTLFWYGIYDNFDCSYIYDYSYIIFYNLAFSSLPVIFMGIFDQDVDDKVSLAVPQLYRRGIERKEYTQTKFWLYMVDGLYQSAIVWYMTYELFAPATFNTEDGRDINDSKRIGVYSATAAVIVVNFYVLFNTYRWDWLTVLINAISTLFIFFWTGVYTAGTLGFTFHGAAAEVYGQLSFWAFILYTAILCLLPRFAIKSAQKMFFPRDVDIIREQVRQGKFDYLKHSSALAPPGPDEKDASLGSRSNSDQSKKRQPDMSEVSEDLRPMMEGSVAPSATSRSHAPAGSDGTTEYAASDIQGFSRATTRPSTEIPPVITEDLPPATRPPLDRASPSYDRPRPSFDRFRSSVDRVRPSFEHATDFTSAANLMRMESSDYIPSPLTPARDRRSWGAPPITEQNRRSWGSVRKSGEEGR